MTNTASAIPRIVENVLVMIKNAPESFNLRDRLMGPEDYNLQFIANEFGVEVSLHGIGSGTLEPNTRQEANEPLHFRISHSEGAAIEMARPLVMLLVETIQKELEELYPQKSSALLPNPQMHTTELVSKLQNFQRPPVSQMSADPPNSVSMHSSQTMPKPNTYNIFLNETSTAEQRNLEDKYWLSGTSQEADQGPSSVEKMPEQSGFKTMDNETNATSQQQQQPPKKKKRNTAQKKKAIKEKLASKGIPWDPKKFGKGKKKKNSHKKLNNEFSLSLTTQKFPRQNSLPLGSNIKSVESNFQNTAPPLSIGGQKYSQENVDSWLTSSVWKFPKDAFSAPHSKGESDSLQKSTFLSSSDNLKNEKISWSSLGQKCHQKTFNNPPTVLQSKFPRNSASSIQSNSPTASSPWNQLRNSLSPPHSNCKSEGSNLKNVNTSLFSEDKKSSRESLNTQPAASPRKKQKLDCLPTECNTKCRKNSSQNAIIKIAIVPLNYPDQIIQDDQVDEIEAGLLDGFSPLDDGSYPAFSGSYLNKGALILCCNNEATKAWLLSAMENFKPFGDKLRLKIVNHREINNGQKVFFRAPHSLSDKTDFFVLDLINKQNPALRSNHWRLISSQPDPRGRGFVCVVDNTNVHLIRDANYKASLGFRQVSLNILKGKNKAKDKLNH